MWRVNKNPSSAMALEAYAAQNPDKIHTDVLTKARESCYKVSHHFPLLKILNFLCSLMFFMWFSIKMWWLCWLFGELLKARDAFYACLEKQSDKKPTEIASVGLLYPVECKQSRAEFVKQCRTSWVRFWGFFVLLFMYSVFLFLG